MVTSRKKNMNSAALHQEPSDGVTVDVHFFQASTEVRQGPLNVRLRARRGFTDVELLLRYTHPALEQVDE